MSWIDDLKLDKDGLLPAVVQDYRTKEVLMVAYMNKEALRKTLKTKKAHFFSRSRQKMWLKGESSGHTQRVKSVFIDCDKDCLVLKVAQKKAACHTGYRSCFYRRAAGSGLRTVGRKVFDPEKVY